MSRKWKPLPTHLPGWHRNDSAFNSFESKTAKAVRNFKLSRKKRQQEKQNRRRKRISNGNVPPIKRLILAITNKDGSIHHSHWSKLGGTWHCLRSEEPYRWFSVSCPVKVATYLHDESISFQWLSPHLQSAELSPAPCAHQKRTIPTTTSSDVGNTPASAVRSNDNKQQSVTHLAQSQAGSSEALERNGVKSPRRLMHSERPELPRNY